MASEWMIMQWLRVNGWSCIDCEWMNTCRWMDCFADLNHNKHLFVSSLARFLPRRVEATHRALDPVDRSVIFDVALLFCCCINRDHLEGRRRLEVELESQKPGEIFTHTKILKLAKVDFLSFSALRTRWPWGFVLTSYHVMSRHVVPCHVTSNDKLTFEVLFCKFKFIIATTMYYSITSLSRSMPRLWWRCLHRHIVSHRVTSCHVDVVALLVKVRSLSSIEQHSNEHQQASTNINKHEYQCNAM